MDYVALRAELDAGHPDTGPYNADDRLARDELNALNRPITSPTDTLIDYFIYEQYRTGPPEGQATKLYGRLEQVARSQPGDDVFSDGTLQEYHTIGAASTMIRILNGELAVSGQFDLTDARFDAVLDSLVDGKAIGPPDRTAIQGLGANRQSRASELGLGRVRTGDVEYARSSVFDT